MAEAAFSSISTVTIVPSAARTTKKGKNDVSKLLYGGYTFTFKNNYKVCYCKLSYIALEVPGETGMPDLFAFGGIEEFLRGGIIRMVS